MVWFFVRIRDAPTYGRRKKLSKKAVKKTLTLLWTCRAFFGLGDDG
jgi:hypothetical protein